MRVGTLLQFIGGTFVRLAATGVVIGLFIVLFGVLPGQFFAKARHYITRLDPPNGSVSVSRIRFCVAFSPNCFPFEGTSPGTRSGLFLFEA